MASHIDTKFSFLNGHHGPGARKGHHMMVSQPLERSRSDPAISRTPVHRGQSLAGRGIPAGYSAVLGNRLGLAAYANLNGSYVARLDVPPPCRAPRKMPQERRNKMEETFLAPERMKPETMKPAGGLVERIKGKRMVEDNTNYLSNVDTLIFGRDVDGSMGCRASAHTDTYRGSAGVNAKVEREPAWGTEPPVCLRTFGADGENGWDEVHYERHDPRKDYLEPGIAQ